MKQRNSSKLKHRLSLGLNQKDADMLREITDFLQMPISEYLRTIVSIKIKKDYDNMKEGIPVEKW